MKSWVFPGDSHNNISEHGFARLTSNIGILLAHGRRMDLKDTFRHMMDLCAKGIPVCHSINSHAGNDFAVREICCCLMELETSDVFSKEQGQPMVYDLVTRLQFMTCLHFGYDGPAKEIIEENLLKSAIHTLEYLSVTGELPYGGRSNGLLFNEEEY